MLSSPSRPTVLAAAALMLAGRTAPIAAQVPTPRTRAERTNYAETSHYADVIAFLDSLQLQGAPVWIGSMGTSTEGRSIPYVIASRPLVSTAAQARRMERPVVYV